MPRQRNTVARKKVKKWLAIPKGKRKEATGIGTQEELAEVLGIASSTLSRWKKQPGFMDGVEHERRLHLDEALSDVYDTMIERAKEGDPQHTKMVLEQAGRYKEEVNPKDVGPSEEDVSNASNVELAGMIAEMLSDAPGVGEAQLQAAILQSLGEDVPDKLVRQVAIEAKASEKVEATLEDDEEEEEEEEVQSVDDDVAETTDEVAEGTEEDKDDDWLGDLDGYQGESDDVDPEDIEEFELEDHLMSGMEEDKEEETPTPDYNQQDTENEPTESTEDFEIPLEW